MWTIVAAGVVLLLPGLAWWFWFDQPDRAFFPAPTHAGGGGEKRRLDFRNLLGEAGRKGDSPEFFPVFVADIIGASLALTALVALGAYLLGWRFTSLGLVVLYTLAAALALIGFYLKTVRTRAASLPAPDPISEPARKGQAVFRSLAVFAGLAALLGWRFYQAQQLALPAWVDSIHHVLIVRVILEQGGVPHSLAPYLPVAFYYHYGFHVLAAVFAFWSGLQPQQAVLWIGQVLNALVAFSIFRLGISLWGDFRRAGLAALLVGFAFQMPAYYLTWGRYTLLTGLVLLPLAMAAALDISNRGANRERIARLTILTAGVLLAHYLAGLLLGIFIGLLGVQAAWSDWREGQRRTTYVNFRFLPINEAEGPASESRRGWIGRSRLLALASGSLLGVLLAGGWLVHVWGFTASSAEITPVTSTAAVGEVYFPDYLSYLWRLSGPGRNYALLSLAPLGLLMAFSRPRTRATALWAGALALLSLPWGLRLGPFRPDHMVIVLFFPAALLVSDLLISIGEHSHSMSLAWVGKVAIGISVLGVLSWGIWGTRTILNPATILAGPADVKANGWIAENTPPQARFLINTTFWQGSTYRGVDGGYWITALTGRATLLPPVVYDWGSAEYKAAINSLAQETSQLEGCTAEFWQVVDAGRADYVYVVDGKGSLQPSNLEGCDGLQQVYSEGGVFIYKINK